MSLIHRVLQHAMGRSARLVCARPALIVAIGLLLAAFSTWVVITRFNVINNTNDLLSENIPSKKNYDELLAEFGSDYRFIVLIQSPDVAKNRKVADDVGGDLRKLSPQITTVLDKIDFTSIKPRLLFTLSTDQLTKIADELENEVKTRQETSDEAHAAAQTALDLNSILDEANQKFDDKYLRNKKNWPEFNRFIDQFISILDKVSAQAEGKKITKSNAKAGDDNALDDFDSDEQLAQHEYLAMGDGQSILVIAYTGLDDPDGQAPFSDTTDRIRKELKDLEAKNPGVTIELTGEPALDTDQIITSTNDSIKALLITVALIIGLFFLSYRAFLRPALTFLVLIMAVLWSLGFALIVVGHFNILSIAVIPMVLGIGIDFGIQILGRYEEELGRGRTIDEAVTAAMRHTGVAIITGGSTTAAAFFTLCFNDFVGLSELGIIAGTSMIFCIAANLFVLPSAFILRDRLRNAEQLMAQSGNSAWNFIHSWDRDLVRTPWVWIGASVVISIVAALSLSRLSFDYNLLHLQNQTADSVKALYDVMNASKTGQGDQVSTIYASVVADNVDQARKLSENLLKLPSVAKVDSILALLPEDQDKKLPVIKRIIAAATALNVKPSSGQAADIPRAQKDVASLLSQSREGLTEAKNHVNVSALAKEAVTAFGKLIPALDRADKALHSEPLAVIQERFSPTAHGAFSEMQANMELLKTQKADRGLEPGDLPPQLQTLFYAPKSGKILLQVYGKEDLWERGPNERFVKEVLTVAGNATGTPVLNYDATNVLLDSYLWAAVWAFVAIVVLIFLHFQSFKFLLLTLAPLILAVLWRTGAMAWFGIEFNPANIVTLPLIIGIDVAFGVYIIDRYREDGRLKIFSESTGKAIIMSSLTSLFGFSSLLVSQFQGMYSIGVLMSLGIAIGLVTAIFILPQILVLLKPRTPEDEPATPGPGQSK